MAINAAAGFPQQSGILIPEVWSGKLLQKFYAACAMAQICNTDYEGEIKNQGDKVIIRTRPDIEIRNYSKGMSLAIQKPQPTTVEFPIERAKYWNVQVDDIDEFQSDMNFLEHWTEDAGSQMKIEWDRDFFADVYVDADAANRGATAGKISASINLGVAGSANIVIGNGSGQVSPIQFLLGISQVMDEQNLPDEGRSIVLPVWFTSRLKNSEIKDASLSGDGTSTLRSGVVGKIDRLKILQSNLLPTEMQSSTKCWNGVANHISGISFAAQLTKNKIIRDLESTFGSAARGLAVADWKVLKPESVVSYCISAGTM
ncbi:MAG: hypothetical protein IPL86_15860 [Flavobacteriales bacterium]|nr:hypothetical protein [Flavobacteriales bacterium]